uniref:Tudor domain-containing protein n=1 Tax=Strongyloides papillosus TaxID=174720 RepID=A0A0N5BAC4_STREA
MIPRKYTSLNSPIMAINVITSCLSTVPSDCSSIFSVVDSGWKVKGEIITETEISQISTTTVKEFYKEEIELEYQDCSDDPSILFKDGSIKSCVSALVDSKKIKPSLPIYLFYAYPVSRARIYKSFQKTIYHEVKYVKEQALWGPPNNKPIHSVVLMISDIIGMEQINFNSPVDEECDNILKINYTDKRCSVVVGERLINSQILENDIKCFSLNECVEKKAIEVSQRLNKNKKYTTESIVSKEETKINRNTSLFEGKYISKNFKGTMNIKDRIGTSINSGISKYINKLKIKNPKKPACPSNAYFSKDNIQFEEYVDYDNLPEQVIKKPSAKFKTSVYIPEEKHQTTTKSSTIVDTINEAEALEEGDINYSMISTEMNDEQLSTICDDTIQEIDCEKLTRQLNVVNIENHYTNDSSKLISLPNTFSFLSKDFSTSSGIQKTTRENCTSTCFSEVFEKDDESVIYEDMLQQLNSIKDVLNNFDTL